MGHNSRRRSVIALLVDLIEEDYEKFHDKKWYEASRSTKAFYAIDYVGLIISNILDSYGVNHDINKRSRSDIGRYMHEIVVKDYNSVGE